MAGFLQSRMLLLLLSAEESKLLSSDSEDDRALLSLSSWALWFLKSVAVFGRSRRKTMRSFVLDGKAMVSASK